MKFKEVYSNDKKREATQQEKNSACWQNVEDLFCPFCSHVIEENNQGTMFFCVECNFKISSQRREEIINEMYE